MQNYNNYYRQGFVHFIGYGRRDEQDGYSWLVAITGSWVVNMCVEIISKRRTRVAAFFGQLQGHWTIVICVEVHGVGLEAYFHAFCTGAALLVKYDLKKC